jgi:hypothetical protein
LSNQWAMTILHVEPRLSAKVGWWNILQKENGWN